MVGFLKIDMAAKENCVWILHHSCVSLKCVNTLCIVDLLLLIFVGATNQENERILQKEARAENGFLCVLASFLRCRHVYHLVVTF